ncbi:MAG: rhomboid family intramembrane serine protease [Gammaproteobacteria bacterium]|nr:MAG: rhomboid family intramembrane serine protease [Gammaproteobacteria bacterium]
MTTLIIIAITCIVSFMAFNNPRLIEQLILWPPAVKRGQYYRLVSHGLIHSDTTHLLLNMLTLFFFGRAMEPLYTTILGPFGFALFYVSAIVVAILPTYLANRDNANYHSLGASGGVSAVLFAFILMQPWATILVWFVPMPAILYAVAYVIYSFYMERKAVDNINHSAHLWGAAYGIAFTVVAAPRTISYFLEQLSHPSFRL